VRFRYLTSLMWFSVRVPVLSVAKISMLPKVGIAVRRLTITPLAAIATEPLPMVTVMIMGKNSGVRPTATAMAKVRD